MAKVLEAEDLVAEEQKHEVHQVYRDVALLGVGPETGAWQLPQIDEYLNREYLSEGWEIKAAIPCGIRNIGEDARAPRMVLGMLYVLVK